MANLTREDILKLANLSKLDLTEEQLERFTGEIDAIIRYIEQLQSADVEGVEPTNQVTGLVSVTRSDETRKYASKEELLKNLPDREGDQIKVRRMIG